MPQDDVVHSSVKHGWKGCTKGAPAPRIHGRDKPARALTHTHQSNDACRANKDARVHATKAVGGRPARQGDWSLPC
jgi:hypothetical protein